MSDCTFVAHPAPEPVNDVEALRAENARLRESLMWIERRGSEDGYKRSPQNLAQVMARIARQALTGGQ